MPSRNHLTWLDVEEIGLQLHATHPLIDPLSLRFTALRQLVEKLPSFKPDPDHPVNEKILETIQMAWHDERQDSIAGRADEDDDD